LPDRGSPTVRGRRLAVELRRLRERAGLNGEEVAERLGWSGSKVSRIELQRTGVKRDDLLKLLDLYEVGESRREELLALVRKPSRKDPLEVVAASFPPDYAAYLQAEAEAQSIWNWDPQIVPGLLQTADYARAVMQPWRTMFRAPPGDTERRVEARMLRQQVLTRDPPLELSVVIDESVLRRRFGDATVMTRQMARMLEVSELPNVQLRVHPLAGDHPPLTTGAFSYMQFQQDFDVPLHDIVSVEHLEGSYYLEDEEQANRYRVAFEYLLERSLDQNQSRSIIIATAREIW
jgi:transcriptional regulator with XRE-family HTH domain